MKRNKMNSAKDTMFFDYWLTLLCFQIRFELKYEIKKQIQQKRTTVLEPLLAAFDYWPPPMFSS